MKNIIKLTISALFVIGAWLHADACTSFIISGRVTADGRPILFKNRDSDQQHNALAVFHDGRFSYVGLVNADSTWNSMVWGGFNQAGFCIMNTAAYNNNTHDTTRLMDQEGVLMKRALMFCQSLADFETLLDTLTKPLGVDANFGVIDAYGGAAYYETGNFRYNKFDVNDPNVAPNGILIRTNYSFTGDTTVGYGFIRYQSAQYAIDQAIEQHNYTPQHLLNAIARNLRHSLTRTDLRQNLPKTRDHNDFRSFTDYISRTGTSAAIMMLGAPDSLATAQTTMWTVLGQPLVSVAIPIWLTPKGNLPKIVSLGNSRKAPLCNAAITLAKQCFPIERGNGQNYINLAMLINQQNNGIMQQLQPVENEIFKRSKPLIAQKNPQPADIDNLYKWLDNYLNQQYRSRFGIDLLQ